MLNLSVTLAVLKPAIEPFSIVPDLSFGSHFTIYFSIQHSAFSIAKDHR
jgi:hypothetical protein